MGLMGKYLALIGLWLGGMYFSSYAEAIAVDTEPEKEQNIIVNADELRRDNAAQQMILFADAMEKLKGKDQMRFKAVRARFRAARFIYKKYAYLARITERKIDQFRKHNPALYAHINQLRNESGQPVRAYLGSFERFSSHEYAGATFVRYRPPQRNHLPRLILKKEVERGIHVLHQEEAAIKISLATDGGLIDTRHEFGHFTYAVASSAYYYQYLRRILSHSTHQHHVYDGHRHDDPSGQQALVYEKLKR